MNTLQIAQTKFGPPIQGKPQWRVSITNNCNCVQSQILLSCKGFQTALSIDPLILKIQGDTCLLYNGHVLAYNNTDAFSYAWDTAYPFAPVSSISSPPCNSEK